MPKSTKAKVLRNTKIMRSSTKLVDLVYNFCNLHSKVSTNTSKSTRSTDKYLQLLVNHLKKLFQYIRMLIMKKIYCENILNYTQQYCPISKTINYTDILTTCYPMSHTRENNRAGRRSNMLKRRGRGGRAQNTAALKPVHPLR